MAKSLSSSAAWAATKTASVSSARLFDVEDELAGLVGAALQLLDQQPIGGFRKQLQVRQPRVRQPFPDLVEAPGNGGQGGPGGEQARDLPRRREVAEAVEAAAHFDQAEHGELVDHLVRQLAQGRKLVGGVGLGLLIGSALPQPFQELPLAGDGDAVRPRLGEAVGRTAVVEQRPAEFADHEHVGLAGDALARLAAVLSHQRKRIRPFHRREPPREGDGAFEHGAVGFGLLRQRPAFLLPAAPAPARTLVLAAAGFFLVSEPMLARKRIHQVDDALRRHDLHP